MPRLASKADALLEHSSESALLNSIRKLESESARCSAELHYEKGKRKLAEAELSASLAREEILLVTGKKPARRMPKRPRRSSLFSPATVVLCLSDWHAEENVDPAVIEGANKFNLDICRARVERTFEKAMYLLEFSRNICEIRDMVVWLGGDLINGYIHEELQESNFSGPAEAILFTQELVIAGLDGLLEDADLDSILVVTNNGNHGRSTHKHRVSTDYKSSWEWLAYMQIARMYAKDPRIAFSVSKGYHNTQPIQGWKVRFHHGDSIRFQGGSGGITIPVNKAIAQWNKRARADYDIFGHFHQYIDDWNFCSNGCLVGYNAYANSIKASFQVPTQNFVVIDRKYGKTMCLPIFCEKSA